MGSRRARIGVLALQGGYDAHRRLLTGHVTDDVTLVRTPDDLTGLEGLVLPGGESSTMLKLIERAGLGPPLDAFARSGRPVLATCAGLILAARAVTGPSQPSFGWLDVDVARNAWGRQVHSFEARDDDDRWDLVFIRAPRITRVGGGVRVLATVNGEPIAVAQGAVTAASFHPELADEPALHRAAFGALSLSATGS